MPFSTIGRYVPTPVGFARSSKEPLDLYETFKSISNMKDYINTGSVYPGQICKVSDKKTNITLEYLMKRSNTTANKIVPVELYPDIIEKHIIAASKLNSEDGYSLNITSPSNSISTIKNCQLIYSHEDTDATYSKVNLYNPDSYNFSTLFNLELFRNTDGFNLLIIINGAIKYIWKQTINFVESSSTTNTGIFISPTANAKYLYPLLVNGADTGFGLFPKTAAAAENQISLYVETNPIE